jgi:hypothetical protein
MKPEILVDQSDADCSLTTMNEASSGWIGVLVLTFASL